MSRKMPPERSDVVGRVARPGSRDTIWSPFRLRRSCRPSIAWRTAREMRVETAVEADHQLGAGLFDDAQAGLHAVDVERSIGFSQKIALPARARIARSGRRACRSACRSPRRRYRRPPRSRRSLRIAQPYLSARSFAAFAGSIRDRQQPGVRVGGNGAGVDLADASGAEQSECDGHLCLSFVSGFQGAEWPGSGMRQRCLVAVDDLRRDDSAMPLRVQAVSGHVSACRTSRPNGQRPLHWPTNRCARHDKTSG